MKNSNQIILQLNELLAINDDVEKVYLEALNRVESEDLKSFFRAMAYERSEFCRFLQAEIILNGGEPEYPEVMKRTPGKIWSNFKQILSVKDENALLNEVCKMKAWSIKKYYKIIDNIKSSESVFRLLVIQKGAIERSLNAIKLRERLSVA